MLLDRSKALSEDTFCLTLTDESVRVYLTNDTEEIGTLATFGHHCDYLAGLTRVAAFTVNQRHATFHLGEDGLSDFFILAAEDEELHRLTCTSHRPIHRGRAHKRVAQTE